jgi:hypothetical protein
MSGDRFRRQIGGITVQQSPVILSINGAIPRPLLRRYAMIRIEHIISAAGFVALTLLGVMPVVIGMVGRL